MAMPKGKGISRSNKVGVTTPGKPMSKPTGKEGDSGSEVGSRYNAYVEERENRSNPRNDPSLGRGEGVVKNGGLPIVTQQDRKTGKVM